MQLFAFVVSLVDKLSAVGIFPFNFHRVPERCKNEVNICYLSTSLHSILFIFAIPVHDCPNVKFSTWLRFLEVDLDLFFLFPC